MDNRLYLIDLYDIYGNTLTEKQQEYFEDYYFENLTMEEIADNDKISKNAVSKQIKIIKEKLYSYEDTLKCFYKRNKILSIIKDKDLLDKIDKYI